MRSTARNEPERSSVAPAMTVVRARRLLSSSASGGSGGTRLPVKVMSAGLARGLARLDHLQLLELLQPFLDQPVGEAAQPPAHHVDVAFDLHQGEQAPVLERQMLAGLRLRAPFPRR